jgi:hypothetical protein
MVSSHRYTPVRPRQRLAVQPRHVLAGGEVAGGEGLVGQGLRDPGSCLGGEVHDRRGWNMISDGEVRRPWRRVAVPGEGPANRGIERVREHQGRLGMRFPYLDWPRRWRRGAVDGEVELRWLR